LGTAPEFVIEGDEYPSSNTDPRAKFLHYDARFVLMTAAVHDHVNIFPTQDDYEKPFRELVSRMPKDGLLVACKDEPHAMHVARDAACKVVTYALQDASADYHLTDIVYGEVSRFTLVARRQKVGTFETSLLGAHNLQNMAGAAAMLLEMQLVSVADLQKAFASFLGVVRRMDKLSSKSSIPVYEGFGSSREKARAAIDAGERLAKNFDHPGARRQQAGSEIEQRGLAAAGGAHDAQELVRSDAQVHGLQHRRRPAKRERDALPLQGSLAHGNPAGTRLRNSPSIAASSEGGAAFSAGSMAIKACSTCSAPAISSTPSGEKMPRFFFNAAV
jgi:hypothetical protein